MNIVHIETENNRIAVININGYHKEKVNNINRLTLFFNSYREFSDALLKIVLKGIDFYDIKIDKTGNVIILDFINGFKFYNSKGEL